MPSYNFKKNVKLYVVLGGLRYRIDVYPDVSFSQTFDERSVDVKTLHAQANMFDAAVINKANPANFSFTMPVRTDATQAVVTDLLFKYDTASSEKVMLTADIYVDTGTDIYKIERCVIERGTYQITRGEIITLSVEGTASKLTRAGTSGVFAIPGTFQTYNSTAAYIIPRAAQISIGGVVQNYVYSVTLEIVNSIEWIENNTLHKSLVVTQTSETTFPEAFVVSKRNVTGTVVEYVTDDNYTNVNTWSLSSSLDLRVGNVGDYKFGVSIPQVAYTNRLATEDLFLQAYDFRMTYNPANLETILLAF